MELTTYISTIERKGYLKYEYNPLHNYQTDVDIYKITTNVGDVFVPKGKAVKNSTGEILTRKGSYWVDKNKNIVGTITTCNKVNNVWTPSLPEGVDGDNITIYEYTNSNVIKEPTQNDLYAKAGSLIDFTTDLLNFDLKHPVDITVLPSYDGSVNLILNDGKNIPRLINSRFSAREKNTYEIVDRIGENDTNIYNSKDFEKDTSLYFRYSTSPKIRFVKHIGGTLSVGQYCYYFTYCDADDNESDIIAETGVIPVFIGSNKDPFSMDGGIKNQNSNKGIALELSGLDKSYNYVKVYLFRYFADYLQNRVYECKKLYHKYPLESTFLFLNISGNEDGEMIDPNILNISTFNPNHVLTLAQCKNMLFFGNIVKNVDNYKELTDCALRMFPIVQSEGLSDIGYDYSSNGGNYSYYDVSNMYNKVGYFVGEYYRFGVVFIYSNGTLSNVYNTFGYDYVGDPPSYTSGKIYEKNGDVIERTYIDTDDEGWIIDSNSIYSSKMIYPNSKGVLKINMDPSGNSFINKIVFKVHKEVIEHLKTLNISGMFFVRQKRIPTIIAQCYLMPMDDVLEAPIIEVGNKNYRCESFLSLSDTEVKTLTKEYDDSIYTFNVASQNAYAAICPDFLLNLPYYNQIFNGAKFKIEKITQNSKLSYNKNRHYILNESTTYDKYEPKKEVKICSVTENVPTVALETKKYRLNIGEAEEAYRFRFVGTDTGSEDKKELHNIVRGIYSPYLAIYSKSVLETGCLYNIYIEEELGERLEFLDRMNSHEPFYAINDRLNFDDFDYSSDVSSIECFRGDCYSNTFTYRLNRNFNDPSLPTNDEIIIPDTWENYTIPSNKENWEKISRSDVNAVKLGSWITIKVKSGMNYALRSTDHSFVSEEAIMGSERSFYPKSFLLEDGSNKKPDSYLYNDAYRATLGFKCYFTLDNVNYLKDNFTNRIQYSSIAILDSYKNNFRHSLTTYFRDYSQEYGSIQKLVGFEGYLLVVFEHAICIAVINERILSGLSDGEPVFINTHNVLPEELTVISDTYGTQWPESVIKSEAGYVYGVDTIQKKIWRVKNLQIEILSDFKVNKFLIDNITLGERETYPIIGLRNVKTHYNNNKKDIMFTFYDDVHKDEENVWNLCYNELLELFITFYSWVPSYSENIDTLFFSFDRNTSKYLSLLNRCNANIPENTGILLDIPVCLISDESRDIGHYGGSTIVYYLKTNSIPIRYDSTRLGYVIEKSQDGILYHNQDSESINITGYRVEKDHNRNYEYVKFDSNYENLWLESLPSSDNEKLLSKLFEEQKVILIELTPYLDVVGDNDIISGTIYYPTETIAITTKDYIYGRDETTVNGVITVTKINPFTTDFYLHGNSGIIDCQELLYPTHWYGEFHPFEFEFAVNDKIALLKIFTNLIIISNKAEPESFHFEIEGDNYEFSNDKRTMYFRLEATKNLYQNLGSDMLYNRKFTDVAANNYTNELYYRNRENEYLDLYRKFDRVYPIDSQGLVQQVKSTIFPLYYERIDTYNDIYHWYRGMLDDTDNSGYDFKNLSGSEIVWHRRLNLFNIVTHVKNNPIDLVGRMRGNSRYKEGKWNVLIPSISFMLKNETWTTINDNSTKIDGPIEIVRNGEILIPPIVINSTYIPNDLNNTIVSQDTLPNIYKDNTYLPKCIDTNNWTARKETKIRDKWIKIRVRYSGKNLAVIHSLITLYNISYS